MGKKSIRESLSREIANIIVHEILIKHTNKSKSVHFLESEIIEYRSHAEKKSKECKWNTEDKKYIENKALKIIKKKLDFKYSDVNYSEQEVVETLIKKLKDIFEEDD